MPSLAFTAIEKSFGAHRVLRDLNLTLAPGRLTLLLGANGSGKTTLLRIAAGLSRPEKGAVACREDGAESKWPNARVRCGYSGHSLMLYGALTVRENIRLFSRILGLRDETDEIARWELGAVADDEVRGLSKGLQARAGLCRAFLGSPPIVILDEPTTALDEHSSSLLAAELSKKSGRLAVAATHDLNRLAPLADRAIVLHEGRIGADSDEEKFANAPGGRVREVLEAYRGWNR